MNLNYVKLLSFIKNSISDVLFINILIISATVYVSADDEYKIKAYKTINHYSENRFKQKDTYNVRNVKSII